MTDPNSNPAHPQPAGMLLIDKPLRRTSMDICALVRARLRRAGAPKRTKVGHGGTLDPLATGLLVVLVGKATRLTESIMTGQKEYLATIDLAHTSPTDDLESEPQPVPIAAPPTRAHLEAALTGFLGTIMQAPPAHSAIKVDGRRAYDLARAGEDPRLQPRPVRIDHIELVDLAWPRCTLRIVCGRGTYIRSLARDLGHALHTGGMLVALRRTRIGRFTIDDALTPDQLPAELREHDLRPVPTDAA